MQVTASNHNPPADRTSRPRRTFSEDFKRFFVRGLSALLPTLITLWLLIKVWEFLWDSLGRHIIWGIMYVQHGLGRLDVVDYKAWPAIKWFWEMHLDPWLVQLIGVTLAVVLVYIVGVLVGNFIGRAAWGLAEVALMRIPLVRAIYPAVKQVTEFVLAERKNQFVGSRVVAVQPHEKGIWSIGLVTGPGLPALDAATGQTMVTVFVPSTPTAFSGYVMVVPREELVELPLTAEEAFRLLISGGVITPGQEKALPPTALEVIRAAGATPAPAPTTPVPTPPSTAPIDSPALPRN